MLKNPNGTFFYKSLALFIMNDDHSPIIEFVEPLCILSRKVLRYKCLSGASRYEHD